MIETVVTVSPDITHEEVLQPIEESSKNDVNTNEILAPPSQAPPSVSASPELPVISQSSESPPQVFPEQVTAGQETVEQESPEQKSTEQESPDQESTQPEEQQTLNTNSQKKRRRKGKIPEFQEENNIDDDFASRLDMTCIEGTIAPAVSDAYIVEYIRY